MSLKAVRTIVVALVKMHGLFTTSNLITFEHRYPHYSQHYTIIKCYVTYHQIEEYVPKKRRGVRIKEVGLQKLFHHHHHHHHQQHHHHHQQQHHALPPRPSSSFSATSGKEKGKRKRLRPAMCIDGGDSDEEDSDDGIPMNKINERNVRSSDVFNGKELIIPPSSKKKKMKKMKMFKKKKKIKKKIKKKKKLVRVGEDVDGFIDFEAEDDEEGHLDNDDDEDLNEYDINDTFINDDTPRRASSTYSQTSNISIDEEISAIAVHGRTMMKSQSPSIIGKNRHIRSGGILATLMNQMHNKNSIVGVEKKKKRRKKKTRNDKQKNRR